MRSRFVRLLSFIALIIAAANAVHAQKVDPVAKAAGAPLLQGAQAVGQHCETARWGLSPSDFSVLEFTALTQKLAKGGHVGALRKVDKSADGCTLYLAAMQARLDEDDERDTSFRDLAAQRGLVRATTEVAVYHFFEAPTEQRDGPLNELRQQAQSGNAFSAFWLGQLLLLHTSNSWSPDNVQLKKEATGALYYSGLAGYAPAQLWLAKKGFEAVAASGASNDAALKTANSFLDLAVAQGYSEAVKYAEGRTKGK